MAGNKELKFSQEKLAPWALPTPELETLNAGGDARDFKFDTRTQRLFANPFPNAVKKGVGTAREQGVEKPKTTKAIPIEDFLKAKGF